MWKRSTKHTARFKEENIGCMQGLFNMFDIRPGHSGPKLLSGSPRRSGSSARKWISKRRNKPKLLKNVEERPPKLTHSSNLEAGNINLGAGSVYNLEEEMAKMQQPNQVSNTGKEKVLPDAGSSSNIAKNQKEKNNAQQMLVSSKGRDSMYPFEENPTTDTDESCKSEVVEFFENGICSSTQCEKPVDQILKQETDLEQLDPSKKKMKRLQCTGRNSAVEYQILDSDPELLSTHLQDPVPARELSSPKGFEKKDHIGAEPVEASGRADAIYQINSEEAIEVADGYEHYGSSPCSTLDFYEETQQLHTTLVASIPGASPIPNKGIAEHTTKLDQFSPVSVLESLFLDKVIRPGSIKTGQVADGFRLSRRKIDFDEPDNREAVFATSNPETNFHTCVDDDEFKFEYMRALLEASGLCYYDSAKRGHTSNQLLDPSLYDEVETPSEEIPDDLRLLFDCINEVLEEIYENSCSCLPWVSFVKQNLRPFPFGENLIQEAWRSLNMNFVHWWPMTADEIIRKEMDVRAWIDLRYGVEEIGLDFGEEILDKILEEAIIELWR